MGDISAQAAAELAPNGVLRAGINTGNFLLVTGRDAAGGPTGVAPDMAREIAARLGVSVQYVPFARPNELADAAADGVWDIGLIGAEPARARIIAFTPAYVEIEASYLVHARSPLATIAVSTTRNPITISAPSGVSGVQAEPYTLHCQGLMTPLRTSPHWHDFGSAIFRFGIANFCSAS